MDLGELDITTEDVQFDAIDEDILRFQQEPKIKEALMQGIDMREYSQQTEEALLEVEKESIDDYIRESDNLASLHTQILACDSILGTMEDQLSGFQAQLGSLSSEIKHLQDESFSMSIKLKNRKAVEAQFGRFLEGAVVDGDLIRNIVEGEVNELYMQYLQTLNQKIAFAEAQKEKDSQSVTDVLPQLDKLRVKALSKIREFLMAKFAVLKKPRTNIQILQQNVLLHYKYLNQFLLEHGPEVAKEVRDAYTDIMAKIYHGYFSWYIKSLTKLKQTDVATRHDLLGVSESQARSLFGTKMHKGKGGVFSLGDRARLLEDSEAPAIVYHVAQKAGEKLPYEAIFRSMGFLVLDTATSEYVFNIEFFGKSDIFDAVFAKTLSMFISHVEDYLNDCHDSLGMLVMIRVVRQHMFTMQKRCVPALDSFYDRLYVKLWPRFKLVYDNNMASLHNASVKALWGEGPSTQPHYVVRRYADFIAGIHTLCVPEIEEMLDRNLTAMRMEFEGLLVRMAGEFQHARHHIIFLINNYDLVLSVLNEHGDKTSDDVEHFSKQLHSQVSSFVEDTLTDHYGDLISYVKDMEPRLVDAASNDAIAAIVNASDVEKLVQQFNATWKNGVEQINAGVMQFFPNFENGVEILKQVFSQLMLYHSRFIDIIRKRWSRSAFERDLVTVSVLLYEIKKLSKFV